jgi:hypothetical protein
MTDAATPRKRPAAVSLAALVLLVLATTQVLVAALFVVNQPELAAAVARTYPAATPGELDERLIAATIEGTLVHAMMAIVYTASAWTMRLPANAVRIFITALALIAMLTDALILGQLPAALPSQAALIYAILAVSTLLRLGVIGLLWLGAPVRAWYAGKPA